MNAEDVAKRRQSAPPPRVDPSRREIDAICTALLMDMEALDAIESGRESERIKRLRAREALYLIRYGTVNVNPASPPETAKDF